MWDCNKNSHIACHKGTYYGDYKCVVLSKKVNRAPKSHN